jgi:uncharacterized lipoprotein YajG
MARAFLVLFVLALAGCSGMPQTQSSTPAATCLNPAISGCQVEMYMNAGT